MKIILKNSTKIYLKSNFLGEGDGGFQLSLKSALENNKHKVNEDLYSSKNIAEALHNQVEFFSLNELKQSVETAVDNLEFISKNNDNKSKKGRNQKKKVKFSDDLEKTVQTSVTNLKSKNVELEFKLNNQNYTQKLMELHCYHKYCSDIPDLPMANQDDYDIFLHVFELKSGKLTFKNQIHLTYDTNTRQFEYHTKTTRHVTLKIKKDEKLYKSLLARWRCGFNQLQTKKMSASVTGEDKTALLQIISDDGNLPCIKSNQKAVTEIIFEDSKEKKFFEHAKKLSKEKCEMLLALGQYANDNIDRLLENLTNEAFETLISLEERINKEIEKKFQTHDKQNEASTQIDELETSMGISDVSAEAKSRPLDYKYCKVILLQCACEKLLLKESITNFDAKLDTLAQYDSTLNAMISDKISQTREEEQESLSKKYLEYKRNLLVATYLNSEKEILEQEKLSQFFGLLKQIDDTVDKTLNDFVSNSASQEGKDKISERINTNKDEYKRHLRQIACDAWFSTEPNIKKREKAVEKKLQKAEENFCALVFKDRDRTIDERKRLNVIVTAVLSLTVVGLLVAMVVNKVKHGTWWGLFGKTKSHKKYTEETKQEQEKTANLIKQNCSVRVS